MALHKNKVIEFIERYPHSSNFSLLNTRRSIAIRPGDPGSGNVPVTPGGGSSTGGTTTPNTPAPIIPGCTVGLSGVQGNPTDFRTLLDLWNSDNDRYKLNPIALMRFAAALYRTYYDWVKPIIRNYPNPNNQQVSTERRLIGIKEYSVFYEATGLGAGGWSQARGLLGGFVNGFYTARVQTPRASSHTNSYIAINDPTAPGFVAATGAIIGAYGDETFNTKTHGAPLLRPTQSGWGHFEQLVPEIIEGEIVLPNSPTTPSNVIGVTQYQLPYGLLGHINGGPNKITIRFNEATIVDNITIPGTNYVFSSVINGLLKDNRFIIRSSIDGITYDKELNFGDFYNNTYIGQANGTATYPSGVDDRYDSRNGRGTWVGAVPYEGEVVSISTPLNANYEQVPYYGVGTLIEGNVKKTIRVRHIPSNTFLDADYEAYMSKAGVTPNINITTVPTNLLNIVNDVINSKFTIRDTARNVTIIAGTYRPTVLSPTRRVKAIEIIGGPDDTVNVVNRKTYCEFPFIRGIISRDVVRFGNQEELYVPNYETEPFWTNFSPESYQISNIVIKDTIAQNAFQLAAPVNLTNVDKWKLLSYTLPSSSIYLQSQVNESASTIGGIPIGFEYTEDYIDNRVIPLPTPEEYEDNLLEASILGENPVQYWFRKQFNLVLNEFILHCQNTCLKFWKLNYDYSVRNYREYRERALIYQNETLNVASLPGTQNIRGKIVNPNIETFTLAEGEVDIENSAGPSRLWFLSGGGYVRVDVAQRLLDNVTDLNGVTT